MSWAGGNTTWCSYTEDQIREIVRQALRGEKIAELASRYQVPEFVIRGWQSRYRDVAVEVMVPSRNGDDGEARQAAATVAIVQARVAHLEEENARLRRILADIALENRVLRERLSSLD
ncbi:MAG TPA: transposase [Candidatus Binatia bacterium]|nr:transposase [Candidatus Binatia bacterium]